MPGITIVSVEVIGFCSKHKKDDIEKPRFKDGRKIPDDMIFCLECKL